MNKYELPLHYNYREEEKMYVKLWKKYLEICKVILLYFFLIKERMLKKIRFSIRNLCTHILILVCIRCQTK